MENLEGQKFAGYEVLSLLGRGGMGAVYKARQPLLNRIVALKVMAPDLASDPDFVARFVREAASAANLRHPNLVEVHTAGEHNGAYFMAMEFVEGESLRKRLDRLGRIPPQEAIAITIYVAQALQHAWNKTKLIHRDIKPDNIFLSSDGEVKVGDLGLAKSVGTETTELTQSGVTMGSPHYISPEQVKAAKDVDFRTDIYSLGCTLFHMLTGETPYTGDSSMVVMLKHVNDPPPAIFKAWPQCPMPLGLLVGRMLSKDRTARPQSYEQLIAELFSVSEKLQKMAAPAPAPAPAPKPAVVVSGAAETKALTQSPTAATAAAASPAKPKNLKAIYAAAGVAAVLALGGLFLWSPWSKPSTQDSNTPSLQLSAASDAFLREVAALPAEQQVKRVMEKLVELNPKFNKAEARERHEIENGAVTLLVFSACNITDISPVRALTNLRKLGCGGLAGKYSPLADLSPLRGLKLTKLIVYGTHVRDLSPLKDMPLTALELGHTAIEDLSPLQGLALTDLQIHQTRVRDLTPLRGMPLEDFRCYHNKNISDLSPLQGAPLKVLVCFNTGVRDLSLLRGATLTDLRCDPAAAATSSNRQILTAIKTLKKINDLPSAEFWKQVDAGKLPNARLALAEPTEEDGGTAADAALKQLGNVYKNAVGAEMVYIPPGKFMMGSTKEEQAWVMATGRKEEEVKCEGEAPRKTAIKEGFWLGRTEVTVGQWKEFVAATGYKSDAEKKGEASCAYDRQKKTWKFRVKGASWRAPGFDQQDTHPVCCVSWNDAAAFCEWLTERERKAGRLSVGQVVRLPTEAEWEYACRAGTQAKFWWSEENKDGKDRLNGSATVDGFEFTSPVDFYGVRGRNKFGLADMLGNVNEWCLDDYDSKQAHEECYKGNPSARVLRGGSFNTNYTYCRCANRSNRSSRSPSTSYSEDGFRVCLGPDVLGSAAADSALRTPQSTTAPAAGWQNAINLLPLIDPQQDAVRGPWTLANGELISSFAYNARLEMPYRPPEEYDFRIVFSRRKGERDIHQMFPSEGRAFLWAMSIGKDTKCGFLEFQPDAVRRLTWLDGSLANGQQYTSVVEVRKDRFRAYRDGKLITEWKIAPSNPKGTVSAVSVTPRDPTLLGVGSYGSDVVFHRIEVREVTGKGTFTRGAPASAAVGDWTTLPNGWRFGKPVNLGSAVNTDANASNPTVSADGLTLFFSSDQAAGGEGGGDLWISTRFDPNGPWGPPVNPGPPVNTRSAEMNPCLSADGLTLLFSSKRPGGQGELDLWMSSRRSPAEPWGTPENLGPTINSPFNDNSPSLTADGLTLLFTSRRSSGAGDDVDIWMSTRSKIGAPWNPPVNLGPPVNGNWKNGSPCLSAGGLALFFESDRPGSRGPLNLWMSTRRSKTEPFGEPVPLPINTKYRNGGPALSTDDRTLYFNSDRPGGRGWQDLWQVPILPPDSNTPTVTP